MNNCFVWISRALLAGWFSSGVPMAFPIPSNHRRDSIPPKTAGAVQARSLHGLHGLHRLKLTGGNYWSGFFAEAFLFWVIDTVDNQKDNNHSWWSIVTLSCLCIAPTHAQTSCSPPKCSILNVFRVHQFGESTKKTESFFLGGMSVIP